MHINETNLANRIDAINKLHIRANSIFPQIKSVFNKYIGKKTVTKQGFTAKMKEEIAQFSKYDEANQIRSMVLVNALGISGGDVWLKMDISYRTGEFSCSYYKLSLWIARVDENGILTQVINNETNLRSDYSLETVIAKQKEIEFLRETMGRKIAELENEIRPVIER